MASNLYEAAILQHPIRGVLYREFKNEIDPQEGVHFQFENLVYFVIAAAASGIVGNLAYDAVKAILRRLTWRNQDELTERLERVISEVRYERLRSQKHSVLPPSSEPNEVIVREIRTKYRLLVERKKKKDS